MGNDFPIPIKRLTRAAAAAGDQEAPAVTQGRADVADHGASSDWVGGSSI